MFWSAIITGGQAFVIIFLFYIVFRFLSWLRFKHRIFQTFRRQSIPGPSPSFWFGNLPDYLRQPCIALDQWSQQYGKYYGFFRGHKPVLVIGDVDDVQEILLQQGRLFPNRMKAEFTVEPFASSILDVRDRKWRHARRVLTPPFTAHKLAMETTRTSINLSVKRLLDSLEQKLDSNSTGVVNITRHMNAITLDVICRLAFSMHDTDVHQDQSEIREMAAEFMHDKSHGIIQLAWYFPILSPVMRLLYHLFGGGKFVVTLQRQLNRCLVNHFQRKLKEKLDPSINGSAKKTNLNLLDYMLDQHEQGTLNETEVIGNAIVTLLAGSDTTATGLAYTLYLLAKDPPLQEQLRQEIEAHSVDEADDNQTNYCQFDEYRCELLERVWHESLRLYPPVVAMVTRELETGGDKFVLPKSGLIITPEITAMIPVWTIHHNPEYWPEPYRFDPFRENLPVPDSSAMAKKAAYLPFGLGQRNCIGKSMAMTESRAVLSALLRRYRFELEPTALPAVDPKTGLLKGICPTVISYPEKPIHLRITRI